MKTIGVISDTHGLLRPQVADALAGSDLILHAGDVGTEAVLSALEQIAPVHAVRGNVDHDVWSQRLPWNEVVSYQGTAIYLLHDLGQLDLDPAASGFQVVVYGHSHQPGIRRHNGVLYLNPGSAGPRRFRLPVTVARLHLGEDDPTAEIVDLAL